MNKKRRFIATLKAINANNKTNSRCVVKPQTTCGDRLRCRINVHFKIWTRPNVQFRIKSNQIY